MEKIAVLSNFHLEWRMEAIFNAYVYKNLDGNQISNCVYYHAKTSNILN